MNNNVCSRVLQNNGENRDLAGELIKILVNGQEPEDDRQLFQLQIQMFEARLVYIAPGNREPPTERTNDVGDDDDDVLRFILSALESGCKPG